MSLIAKRSRTTKQLSLTLFPDLESSSLSADAVASNEDLLTEILLHLPVRSLIYFKSVSKHWLSLITNPRFSLLRSPLPLTASALFLCCFLRKPEYEFVPLDNDNCNSAPFKTLSFVHDPLGIRIIQSCNGLLLCSSCRGRKSEHKYFIYNPTTKQFTILPQLCGRFSRIACGMSLAFDPSKSPHYKVVCVRRSEMSRDHFQIEIYSSESGPWRVSGQPFSAHFDTNFGSGVYWNGSVHWINHCGGNSNSLYFNVDDERLEKMPMHPIIIHGDLDEIGDMALIKDSYFGESNDHLHLIEVYGYMAVLDVYEMKRDYSGWFVKYKVNLSAISNVFPEMINCQHDLTGENDYAVAVKSLVRREKDVSFLVLEIPGKAIRYNLVSNSFEKLCEFAPADTKYSGGLLTFGECSEGFQFIESLACV